MSYIRAPSRPRLTKTASAASRMRVLVVSDRPIGLTTWSSHAIQAPALQGCFCWVLGGLAWLLPVQPTNCRCWPRYFGGIDLPEHVRAVRGDPAGSVELGNRERPYLRSFLDKPVAEIVQCGEPLISTSPSFVVLGLSSVASRLGFASPRMASSPARRWCTLRTLRELTVQNSSRIIS